jgi:hypothetical protein
MPMTDADRDRDGDDLGLLAELWLFIREHKAYWIVPLIIVLVLMVTLITLGSTAAAPFIYTLF